MPIIATIVAQHTEEAAFLWLLRDAAVTAPHYSLKDLAEFYERVEVHIDGLRVAGEPDRPLFETLAQGFRERVSVGRG